MEGEPTPVLNIISSKISTDCIRPPATVSPHLTTAMTSQMQQAWRRLVLKGARSLLQYWSPTAAGALQAPTAAGVLQASLDFLWPPALGQQPTACNYDDYRYDHHLLCYITCFNQASQIPSARVASAGDR